MNAIKRISKQTVTSRKHRPGGYKLKMWTVEQNVVYTDTIGQT